MSEDEIMQEFESSPNVVDAPEGLEPFFIPEDRQIAPGVVAKFNPDGIPFSEPVTMELAAALTTIPVPTVYGFSDTVLAMQYIPGRTLGRVWPELGLWKKLWVIWTIRGYIRQLWRVRTHQPQIPGPAGPHSPAPCVGRFFGEEFRHARGPFPTYADLAEWFRGRMRLTLTIPFLRLRPKDAVPFDDTQPLTLVHLDINRNNIILGDDGRLWLIDWEWSGFYHRWFEYSSMMCYSTPSIANAPSRLWNAMIPFMAGFYSAQDRFMSQVGWALDRGLKWPAPDEIS
ncbi:hypothetical protein VKT23_017399 [Stygiomarasmius scandens]|uniref:Aminoglycoside phosphotransferase domain-containing protein n=1 Tax=Marasmiellus scandens TaxID=2682957 RepID=A0ABR1IUP0_9AGAR